MYRIVSYRISYHIISYHISYHIVSYRIVSYRIVSYIISYHIISYIISYRIVSYRIVSYRIISNICHIMSESQVFPFLQSVFLPISIICIMNVSNLSPCLVDRDRCTEVDYMQTCLFVRTNQTCVFRVIILKISRET